MTAERGAAGSGPHPGRADGGGMARLVRAHDWAATPLGPLAAWPERLRAAVDLVLAAGLPMILLLGPELRQVYNDAYRALMGPKHPAGLGQPTRECWPEAWTVNGPIYRRVLAGETVAYDDKPIPLARGGAVEEARFTLSYSPLRDEEEGAVTGVLVTAIETTERHRAEASLRDSEARFRAFVNASADALYRMSPDWSELRRLDGRGVLSDSTEPSAAWMERYVHPDDRAAVAGAVAEVVRTGAPFALEHRVLRADGGTAWIRSRAVPVRDAAGAVVEWFGTAADASARHEAEASRREDEVRMRILADGVVLSLWEADGSGAVVSDSPAWRAQTGQSREEWLDWGWLDALHPCDRADAERRWRDALAAGRPVHLKYRRRSAEGGWRWVEDWAAPVPDERGGVRKWVGMAIDVDDRHRAEARLRESDERSAFLLALSDALRPLGDPVAIEGTACRLLAERLGADRAYYTEIREAEGVALIARDHRRPDLESFAGEHALAAIAWCLPPLRSGETLVVEDVGADARIPAAGAAALSGVALVAFASAPLIKGGSLVGSLSVTAAAPRRWSEAEVSLLREVGERLWDALGRARAEAALRAGEERQAFLLRLSDALRPVDDPAAVQRAAMRALGRQLRVDRALYFEVLPDGDALRPGPAYLDGVEALPDPLRMGDFGESVAREYRLGRTIVCADAYGDERYGPGRRDAFDATGVRAAIGVPLLRDGRLVAVVSVHQSAPRRWSAADVALVEQVADRAWAAAERARAGGLLRESEARLAAVFESLPVGVGVVAADGTVALSNQAMRRFLPSGLIPSRDAGRGWRWRSWRPDGRPLEHRDFPAARALRGENVVPGVEMLHQTDDGREIWTSVTAGPIRDGQGRIIGTVSVIADVDAVRRATDALGAEKERFRTLAEGIPQLVWRTDAEGARTWTSPQWRAYTGRTEAESLGWNWLQVLHPDDRAAALRAWAEAQARGRLDVQYRVRRASDGAWRWHAARALPVRADGAAGPVLEWLGTTTDVEDLRQMQARQQVLVAELQHRTRNLLGVVRSIARRGIPASPERDAYDARLAALGRVQGYLSRSSAYAMPLREVVEAELAAIGHAGSARVRLDGPAVALPGEDVQAVALALHELATNALKHGALKHGALKHGPPAQATPPAPGGRLSVLWRVLGEGLDKRLVIDWREEGVAMPPGPPARRGYGSELITRALPYQLRADTELRFAADGVRCRIALPWTSFAEAEPER